MGSSAFGRSGKWLVVLLLAAAVLLVATLAIPVTEWRTGDQGLMPLAYRAAQPLPATARRVWIDTDAACGTRRTADPDDCLAIALLVQSGAFELAGVSTTFGNAPRDVVDATVEALLTRARTQGQPAVPYYHGASQASDTAEADRKTMTAHADAASASDALAKALESGPLVILALGPLTNVAQSLRDHPQLRSRVVRLVAVMGRRPGHLFHPAAGAHAPSFLGHGPIMRDFNYAMDPQAVEAILRMDIALTLVPYDAATDIEVTGADLDRLAATGPVMRWATERSRQWLDYWMRDIGRDGFFPFDLVAAAYLLAPDSFGCADVGAYVGTDNALFVPLFRPRALLVSDHKRERAAEYCARAEAGLVAKIVAMSVRGGT